MSKCAFTDTVEPHHVKASCYLVMTKASLVASSLIESPQELGPISIVIPFQCIKARYVRPSTEVEYSQPKALSLSSTCCAVETE